MESLNSYISDGESDSSPSTEVGRKSNSCLEEADANCEPITMDMSEDSCSSQEDKNDTVEPAKKNNSRSLSPSPTTSDSSADSSPDPKKRKDEDRKAASPRDKVKESSKSRRSDEEDRRKKDRDYIKRDDDKDRKYSNRDKSKDRYSSRDKDSDRYRNSSRRYEKKRSHRSRSRSRSRSYSKHSGSSNSSSKRKIKSRSRSKSRSRDRRSKSRDRRSRSRDRRSRSRGDRRSRSRGDRRSRSRDRRSRSRDRHHRHESHRSSKRRSPYKSRRSRSRSHSKEKSRSYDWKSSSKMKVLEKLGIEIKVPPGGVEVTQATIAAAQATHSQLTPQLLLQKTMEDQVEKVKTATGIALPSYYNPIAVNPTKYAEQIQKRRLLWGNKDKQPAVKPTEELTVATAAPKPTEVKGSGTIWQGATFGGDQDGKMTAKFKRLMGIKNVDKDGSSDASKSASGGSDLIKKQEEMFHSMESQYEVARLATHSHRGLGLGFGTFQPR